MTWFMRKMGLMLVLAAALAVIAAGCGEKTGGEGVTGENAAVENTTGENDAGENATGDNASDEKVSVVTSFYPLYDFAQKIGGEHVRVINLVPAGVDPHDWTPKTRDMAEITKADLFIYNGAGFEMWTDDVLGSLDTDVVAVEASRGIDLIRAEEDPEHKDEHGTEEHTHEESANGHAEENHAESEHGHAEESHEESEHGHAEDSHEEGHAHGEYDPHVWISPQRAMTVAANIRDGLIEADPAHKADYEAGYASVVEKLEQLDRKLKEIVEAGSRDHIVVSHHAYAYLARDYGFEQLAVMGLSPDAEPTVQDIRNISDFVREHDVRYILFEELVSPKLAETLAHDLGIETLVFNPVEGLTEQQMNDGEDYFSIMEKNLTTLQKALQ